MNYSEFSIHQIFISRTVTSKVGHLHLERKTRIDKEYIERKCCQQGQYIISFVTDVIKKESIFINRINSYFSEINVVNKMYF